MKNILVFFGGRSCEHDVSVVTGVLTLNSIDKTKYNPVPVYITGNGEWFTGDSLFDVGFYKLKNYKSLIPVTFISGETALFSKKKRLKRLFSVYCAINCLHGVNGEDGTLAGLLKLHNIPLASPSVYGSSLCIDKIYTKTALKGLGVKSAEFLTCEKTRFYKDISTALDKIESKLSYPVIVKPATLGSSIGIETASDKKGLETALKKAFVYDDRVLIEKAFVDFIELNCGAYKSGDKVIVSCVEKPLKVSDILTFNDKYCGFKNGGNGREFPAKIPEKLAKKIRSITEKVYRELDFLGVIRVDYILSGESVYLNEINTVPGSLAYYLFCSTYHEFSLMLNSLIEEGVKAHLKETGRKLTFISNVLQIDGAKGGKLKSFDKKSKS